MANVTIYDVAARAGVSIKTVSRVMNNEHVSGPTREKVLKAAKAMGYAPSLSARSLASSKSFVLTIIVDAELTLEHWSSGRGSDYLNRVQLGVTVPARKAGYHVLVELVDHHEERLRQDLTGLLGALKPDGVILTPPSSDHPAVLAMLKAARIPFVRLGSEVDSPGGARLPLDEHGAAFALTQALIARGHRKIGFITGDARYGASHARRAGFEEAMRAAGLELRPTWIAEGDFTYHSGEEASRRILDQADRPTAIFASNDDMALGCMATADALNLKIPGDLSVAGFDDSIGARFSRPGLTTIRHPLTQSARAAAEALLSGEVSDLAALPFELIFRESTDAVP